MSGREPPRRDACGVPRALGAIAVAAACAASAGCGSTADTEIGVYEPASAPQAAGGWPSSPPTPATGGAPPYDQGVHFMWPESPPQHGMCAGGFYVGNFKCTLDNGAFTFPLEGQVNFTLTQSTGSEFLVIEDGLLDGTLGLVTFRADLAGKLDCGVNHLYAQASNGIFVAPPFIGTFEGELNGNLERSTQTLSGDWSLRTDNIPPCAGTWTAVRQP